MIKSEFIHHISLNVTDLEKSKKFYTDVLCLEEIDRPAFGFPGAWFAIGNHGQQLHLIVDSEEVLKTKKIGTRDGHFAMRVHDFDETISWLEQKKVVYKAKKDSVAGFRQIFVLDPDLNNIEMNTAI